MLVILATSHADHHMLPDLGAVIKTFGPYPGHTMVILPTQDVPPQTTAELKAQIDGQFDSVDINPITISAKTWPKGPNQQFREAAKLALARGQPWLFLEADCVPLRKDWLEALEQERTQAQAEGKLHLGVIMPTQGFDEQGSPAEGEPHLSGVSIYHPSFAKTSVKLPTLDIMFLWVRTPMEPFDVALRHELVPHAKHTKLIAHRFRTGKYRQENGQLVCESVSSNPGHASYASPVNPEAVLLHGAKDDSLVKLILSGLSLPDDPVHATSQEVVAAGANAVSSSSSTPPEVPGKGAFPSFQAVKIAKLLADGKKRRPSHLVPDFGETEEAVRAIIETENSGLYLKGGWIQRAASV